MDNLRAKLAAYLLLWALRAHPECTLFLSRTLVARRERQLMDEQGIERMVFVPDPDGTPVLKPVYYGHDNPTKH